MTRQLSQYFDPLDQIWISAAAKLKFKICRNASAYASYDGTGNITIASDEFLDPDDCLAQLIIHELCHGLVEGELSFCLPDWGLGNLPPEEALVKEHACQRLQAALLRPYGLQMLLAPTTEFRAYYDSLPENPLAATSSDPALPFARLAMGRAKKAPYLRVFREALQKTSTLHRLMQNCFVPTEVPSLWQAAPFQKFHASGFPLSIEFRDKTCGDCVWFQPHKNLAFCQQSHLWENDSSKVTKEHAACVMFESQLQCQTCAACCREGYDIIPIKRKDEILRLAPEWVTQQNHTWFMNRDLKNHRCSALIHSQKEIENKQSYACQIYAIRPTVCRELKSGSEACLIARQRVGLCP